VTDALLDATVLAEAFVGGQGPSAPRDLLRLAAEGAYNLLLSAEILATTAAVLRAMRKRRGVYSYAESAIDAYCQGLKDLTGPIYFYEEQRSRAFNPGMADLDDADRMRDLAIALGTDYIITFNPKLLAMKSIHTELYEEPILIEASDTFTAILGESVAAAKTGSNS
jgi:hypothetical protein